MEEDFRKKFTRAGGRWVPLSYKVGTRVKGAEVYLEVGTG